MIYLSWRYIVWVGVHALLKVYAYKNHSLATLEMPIKDTISDLILYSQLLC